MGDLWQEKLDATRVWVQRRNTALRRRAAPTPVASHLAGLYLEFLDLCAHKRVLDLGCGRGERRKHFHSRYVGLDALLDWYEGDFAFAQGVAEVLPFADAAFDGVISVEALEHFRDPARAASELLRVLRPGGHLLVFVCRGVPEAPAEAMVHLHYFDGPALSALFHRGMTKLTLAESERHLLVLGKNKR